jgi:hypothetical protein
MSRKTARESKGFIFEKKPQKTFANWGIWHSWRRNLRQIGVFLLLFLQKKKRFLKACAA